MSSYIELHASSAFSFLRGASQPSVMALQAAGLGLPALALLERDGVYSAPRFHKAANEQGIRPIVGAELTMEDGTVLPVIARTRTGYRNLCRMLTTAQLGGEKGGCAVPWDLLAKHAEGLTALTGDREGPLLSAWRTGGRKDAAKVIERLQSIFPQGHLYIEIQRHHLREELRPNQVLIDAAAHFHLPLVATNGVLHATPDARRVADVFTCLRNKTHLDQAGRLLERNNERHLKTPEAMAKLFADLPEAVANTLRIAESVEFSLENLGYSFPKFPVPEGETMDSFLRKITFFGAEHRYGGITPRIRQQLEHELALITKLGFSGYFLIVWDIVNFCRESKIMVQGRGSAANSAVCYSLGITAVDPIGGKLLFERFLSEGRKSWPDIDLDLPSGDRRERVIQEVYQRYGRRGAAMTANVITYRGRSAIREIGKALNFPEELLNRFSSLYHSGDYEQTLELKDQLEQAGIRDSHPRAGAMVDLYRLIHGLPRHLGQHSGGMIICQGQLDEVVPLEPASMPGRVVCQWDKDDCEDMGIIKIDLLGLGMMAVLQDAVEMCRQRGRSIDLARIPKDDEPTYDLICRVDTVGVFQIESRAQMATLPRMQPRSFYDLVIEVAIIRPGPIQGNMVHPYLERRSGKAPVNYIDDRLKPVLERTLGVPLFQEQMLQIAMIIADFSGSEAEELRRALNFHRSRERLRKVTVKIEAAMKRKGVSADKRGRIIEALGSFALYGFPESHAISFALLAYASCYLKVHRAAEFYAALLNNQPMGFYSPPSLIQDARRHGIRTLPPCVNASQWECAVVDDNTIRLGLLSVKGVGAKHVEAMLAARPQEGFLSVEAFRRVSPFDEDERRALAAAGALNGLLGDRRSAFWAVEGDWEEDRAGALPLPSAAAREPSPLEMMSYVERIVSDYENLGLTTGSHPFKRLRPQLTRQDIWRAADLGQGEHGSRVKTAGSVICRQRPGTAKGFVFISLEDETGISNAVVAPGLFEKLRLIITQESHLVVTGTLQKLEGTLSVKADDIAPLAQARLPASPSYDFH